LEKKKKKLDLNKTKKGGLRERGKGKLIRKRVARKKKALKERRR